MMMKELTAKAIKEAMLQTGYTLSRVVLIDVDNKKANPIILLWIAAGEQFPEGELLYNHRSCDRLPNSSDNLFEKYIWGFNDGFDGLPSSRPSDRKYSAGWQRGRVVYKELAADGYVDDSLILDYYFCLRGILQACGVKGMQYPYDADSVYSDVFGFISRYFKVENSYEDIYSIIANICANKHEKNDWDTPFLIGVWNEDGLNYNLEEDEYTHEHQCGMDLVRQVRAYAENK